MLHNIIYITTLKRDCKHRLSTKVSCTSGHKYNHPFREKGAIHYIKDFKLKSNIAAERQKYLHQKGETSAEF